MLTPQRTASIQRVQVNQAPVLDARVDEDQLSFMNPTDSIVFRGISKVVIEKHHGADKPNGEKGLFDMDAAKYNPRTLQDGHLNVFKRPNIRKDVWMLPVIPDKVEKEIGSGRYLTDIEKLVAFRTSYQYISIKQKLFFAFEDQEEAI